MRGKGLKISVLHVDNTMIRRYFVFEKPRSIEGYFFKRLLILSAANFPVISETGSRMGCKSIGQPGRHAAAAC
jgi:hypothetical protein